MKTICYSLLLTCFCLCFVVCDTRQNGTVSPDIATKSDSSGCKNLLGTKSTSQDCSELLQWTYNPDIKTLTLVDINAYMNCCIDYTGTVTVDPVSGIYHFNQINTAEMLCSCMCYYDFTIEIPGLDPGIITLEIDRYTLVGWEPTIVWQGIINLWQGSGIILIEQVDSCM